MFLNTGALESSDLLLTYSITTILLHITIILTILHLCLSIFLFFYLSTTGLRHYDVQLIGGMGLHDGRLAEMATGEGKTLVAVLAGYLNALSGRGAFVVTTNDYLAGKSCVMWSAALDSSGVLLSYSILSLA